MSVVPGRPRPAAGSVVAAFLLALAAGGCSAVQESLECPGKDCPAELRSVADDTAGLDGVTSVDRTWRFHTLDHGHSGGVEVHASVGTRQQARALAGRIAGIYQHSRVEKVDTISVVVVPDPERAVRDDSATLLGGEASPGAEVPCARDRCGDEVAGFEDAFAADPVARRGDPGVGALDHRRPGRGDRRRGDLDRRADGPLGPPLAREQGPRRRAGRGAAGYR